MGAHVPHPPIETLSGAWLVERAESGSVEWVPVGDGSTRRLRTWALSVKHVATGATDHVQCRAIPATVYRAGQEIDGQIVQTREGAFFRRARPHVGSRRS